MKNLKTGNWKKYLFEFLSIFIAVFAAFALDSWKESRKDQLIERKILIEIHKGLDKDLQDIKENEKGHRQGIRAAEYFRNILVEQQVQQDSLKQHYFNLFRDFISIQNVSGYETLKSKGLESISNDSLRSNIIALYEYDYNTLRKLEEEYSESQLHESYFREFNTVMAPNFNIDRNGVFPSIRLPVKISESEKKILIVDLWKIQVNRLFILKFYFDVEKNIKNLQSEIEKELKMS